MVKKPAISVVVPTKDRSESLIKCLDSLVTQTFKNFEVLVVDGGNLSQTKEILAPYRKKLKLQLTKQLKPGVVGARNTGWQASYAKIVSFIDDDAIASPNWTQAIQKIFRSSKEIGGVSGPTIMPEEIRRHRDVLYYLDQFKKGNIFMKIIGALYFNVVLEGQTYRAGHILKSGTFTPGSNYPNILEFKEWKEVDYLEACNMSFRKKLLEEEGGFDPAFEGTGEWNEPDFCFRLKKRGHKLIFSPEVMVEHFPTRSGVFQARTRAYERSRNFIRFYFRWIRPNTFEKFFRFGTNLVFINFYWLYKFLQTKNPDWLGGIKGTLSGLKAALLKYRGWESQLHNGKI